MKQQSDYKCLMVIETENLCSVGTLGERSEEIGESTVTMVDRSEQPGGMSGAGMIYV